MKRRVSLASGECRSGYMVYGVSIIFPSIQFRENLNFFGSFFFCIEIIRNKCVKLNFLTVKIEFYSKLLFRIDEIVFLLNNNKQKRVMRRMIVCS